MEIRRAGEPDLAGIQKLLVQVNNVHSEGRPDLFLKDKMKYTKEQLLELLRDEEKPVFVAVDGEGEVLGYVFGVFVAHREDYNSPDIVTFYIDDLCVDESMRGSGVGSALYRYVKEFAREKGCYNITLNVWQKNEAAQRFYKSCGFQIQKYGLETIL